MPNELQVVISVLTAGHPEEINETYLQRKLGLSPNDFAQQYHSFTRLLKVGGRYCFQALKTELEMVWQLSTNTLQQLFYSLIIIQRPENQKRRRYVDLLEHRLPVFANKLLNEIVAYVQDHFYRLLVKAQEEGLLKPNLSPAITAKQLWYLNTTTLWKAAQDGTKSYWLDEVVLELWPLIQQFCTPKGEHAMTVSLTPLHAQTFNHYSQQDNSPSEIG